MLHSKQKLLKKRQQREIYSSSLVSQDPDSSSASVSPTRKIKEIRFIEYQSQQCYHDRFHNQFNIYISIPLSSTKR